VNGEPDWPTAHDLVRQKAGDDINSRSRRPALLKWYVDHLVAIEFLTVPAAAIADEGAAAKCFGHCGIVGEGKAKRRDMAGERVVGRNRLFHQVRPFRANTRVDMLAIIAPRPAVEPVLSYRSHV